MARVRKLQIRNFRSIQNLDWAPSAGVNCLVGPGDSGKSSILDAIDFCLGGRRSISFGDTDFYNLNVDNPIEISVTLGDLSEDFLSLDSYGDFLRGFNPFTKAVEDEPGVGLETVITLKLRVENDLEPYWSLYSIRAEQQELTRSLAWKERTAFAPARIGAYAHTNLSWSRGSILNRLTEDRADLGGALATAARQARNNFGDQADRQLADTLRVVTETAGALGVPVGASAKALLDAHSVSIGDGAIALHNDAGIPLRSLGTGSSRLLIAGLQSKIAGSATIALVDEVEYGLEPHRLIGFLDSLGAKNTNLPMQAFMTTHSPVALRELSGNQLNIVRSNNGLHTVTEAGVTDEIQSTLRLDPEAFLAKFVLVCEGNSEIGFIRGIDQYRTERGQKSIYALGGAYVNVGGGHPDNCFARGLSLLRLGYRVIVVIDSDVEPTAADVDAFVAAGGQFMAWDAGRALEDELFTSLDDIAIDQLIELAKERIGDDLVAQHIQTASEGLVTLEEIETNALVAVHGLETRQLLARTSKSRKNSWFKSLSTYQRIAKEIVCPRYEHSAPEFRAKLTQLWTHINAAGN